MYPQGLTAQELEEQTDVDIERRITMLLMGIGFRQNLTGFHYIREAVKICMNRPYYHNIDADVYKKISERYEVSTSCVERAIRYAISCVWYKGDLNPEHPIFLHSSFKYTLHPTNSELIAAIAEVIRIGIF